MGLGGATTSGGSPSGLGLLGGLAKRKTLTDPEIKADAKKKYEEIFSSKENYEVRLVNKSLAMKRGYFMGMSKKNKLAVFESKRMIVAVPANKLNERLAAECEERIEKARAVLSETGIAFEDVFEIPEDGDNKRVGLAGREKILMFVHRKPKVKKQKASSKKSESASSKKNSEDGAKSEKG